jgi:hypothetical protein
MCDSSVARQQRGLGVPTPWPSVSCLVGPSPCMQLQDGMLVPCSTNAVPQGAAVVVNAGSGPSCPPMPMPSSSGQDGLELGDPAGGWGYE